MAAAVQNNGLQTLPNANHRLEMKPADCEHDSIVPKEELPQDEEQPPQEVDIVINNVVCSFSVRCHLNLRQIALTGTNVEYKRENGMCTMKLRNPYTTASVWSSGKITCTGATSEDTAKKAARRFARAIQKLGFNARFNNFRVVNVLGTCSMPFGIKINCFSAKYPKDAEYEPEIHPGVTYRLKDLKATLKIFSTGSITVTAPNVSSVSTAIERIFPLVFEFRKERTKEEAEAMRRKVAARSVVRKRKDDSDQDMDCESDVDVEEEDGSGYESYD